MSIVPVDILKLLLAVVLGGVLGAEREYRDRAAGFRTIILICMGATLFTIFSVKLGGTQEPARIAASIVSGVGFLGAGAIMRGPIRVAGLTTASTIWLAAALGVGVGAGQYFLSGGGAGLAVVVLAVFPRIEHWIDREHQICTYKVTCSGNSGLYSSLSETIRARGLGARRSALIKCKSQITSTWEVWGPPEGHRMLTEALLSNPEVEEFEI